jgi:hypothetical protein
MKANCIYGLPAYVEEQSLPLFELKKQTDPPFLVFVLHEKKEDDPIKYVDISNRGCRWQLFITLEHRQCYKYEYYSSIDLSLPSLNFFS